MSINNKPSLFLFGEATGDKKGVIIRGNGGNLYDGSFNVHLHGAEMKEIGIKNDKGSIVRIVSVVYIL